MSRFAEIPIVAILAAADRWKQECLVEQRSLFEPERTVWRPEAFAELEQRFIGAPDDGKDSFFTKLGRQLAQASDDAKLLAIDLGWVLYLFPRKIIGPAKKVSNLQEIAASCDLERPAPAPQRDRGLFARLKGLWADASEP